MISFKEFLEEEKKPKFYYHGLNLIEAEESLRENILRGITETEEETFVSLTKNMKSAFTWRGIVDYGVVFELEALGSTINHEETDLETEYTFDDDGNEKSKESKSVDEYIGGDIKPLKNHIRRILITSKSFKILRTKGRFLPEIFKSDKLYNINTNSFINR